MSIIELILFENTFLNDFRIEVILETKKFYSALKMFLEDLKSDFMMFFEVNVES